MMQQYKAALTGKKNLVNNVYLFTFVLQDGKTFDFMPGQYVMIRVPKGTGFLSRMYSVASSPVKNSQFELIIEIVPNGLGSTYINNLPVGGIVDLMGPGGVFTVTKPDSKKIFLVTGTGIAPVRAMLLGGMKNYHIYWGMKTFKDVYLFDELKKFDPKICLSRETSLDVITQEDRRYFDLGHVDTCFEKEFGQMKEEINNLEFYLCGGREVVESLRMKLIGKNIPRENIHFEKF